MPGLQEDLAGRRRGVLARLQRLAVRLAREVRPSFQPNRLSLGYPRYQVLPCTAHRTDLVWQAGLLRPGWCSPGWWEILWRQNDTHAALLDSLQASIQQ